MPNANGWGAIERAAREQAQAELVIAESERFVHGQSVAWAEKATYKTDGLSAVHRATMDGRTLCNEPIPPAKCRLPVYLFRVLRRCRDCDRAYGEGR